MLGNLRNRPTGIFMPIRSSPDGQNLFASSRLVRKDDPELSTSEREMSGL